MEIGAKARTGKVMIMSHSSFLDTAVAVDIVDQVVTTNGLPP